MKTTAKAMKKNERKIKVDFEYFSPESESIQVAGTFNDWQLMPLEKNSNGKWNLSVNLKPGRYEYRYFVDGLWQNDQRQCECVPNAFGTWNCVLEVK